MEVAESSGHELAAKWKKSLALAHAAAQGTICHGLLSKAKQRWCPKDAFNTYSPDDPCPISLALSSEGFRTLQEEAILQYDANIHRLLECTVDVISIVEPRIKNTGLDKIHFAFDPSYVPGKSLKQHKSKLNGELFATPAGQAFRDAFLRFVCEVIAPHVRHHMPEETCVVFQVGTAGLAGICEASVVSFLRPSAYSHSLAPSHSDPSILAASGAGRLPLLTARARLRAPALRR